MAPLVLRTARIALYVAALAAICRIGYFVMRPIAGIYPPGNARGYAFYGVIALIALALQWGIGRHAGIARWPTMVIGALMAAALVAGRGEFAAFWHALPMPLPEMLLFPVRLLIIVGFVVAGVCCAVPGADTAPGARAV